MPTQRTQASATTPSLIMNGKVEQRNIDALMQPIMKEYNSKDRSNNEEFKTSIDYDYMRY